MKFHTSSLFSHQKVLKSAIFPLSAKNSHGYFVAEIGKMPLLRPFQWKNKGDAQKAKCLEIWCYIPKQKLDLSGLSMQFQNGLMGISPKCNIENFHFFQWLAYIKYEWLLQELKIASVFTLKISIYIVCIAKLRRSINLHFLFHLLHAPL